MRKISKTGQNDKKEKSGPILYDEMSQDSGKSDNNEDLVASLRKMMKEMVTLNDTDLIADSFSQWKEKQLRSMTDKSSSEDFDETY